MHIYTFLSASLIIVATLATIIPETAAESKETRNLPSILFTIPLQNLTQNDVIVYGLHNQVKVISRSELLLIMGDIPIATEEQHSKNISAIVPDPTETEPSRTITKRCPKETVWSMNPVKTYFNWDVPMSSVIHAPDNSSASISVSTGYWISNSLSSSASNSNVIKQFMTNNFDVSYSKSWTTTHSSGYTFTIPPGKYGSIVSNPMTIQHSGFMDVGCIGQSTRTSFISESYRSMSQSGMPWVEGIITLCLGDSYPLRRCTGSGFL